MRNPEYIQKARILTERALRIDAAPALTFLRAIADEESRGQRGEFGEDKPLYSAALINGQKAVIMQCLMDNKLDVRREAAKLAVAAIRYSIVNIHEWLSHILVLSCSVSCRSLVVHAVRELSSGPSLQQVAIGGRLREGLHLAFLWTRGRTDDVERFGFADLYPLLRPEDQRGFVESIAGKLTSAVLGRGGEARDAAAIELSEELRFDMLVLTRFAFATKATLAHALTALQSSNAIRFAHVLVREAKEALLERGSGVLGLATHPTSAGWVASLALLRGRRWLLDRFGITLGRVPAMMKDTKGLLPVEGIESLGLEDIAVPDGTDDGMIDLIAQLVEEARLDKALKSGESGAEGGDGGGEEDEGE
jgi:hypothetical protein